MLGAGLPVLLVSSVGRLVVRVRIEHLASARAALLGADVKPLPAVMAVVGRQRYVLRGLPDVNPLVLAQKLADWGWLALLGQGNRSVPRHGTLRVLADAPPPAWTLWLATGPVVIQRDEGQNALDRYSRKQICLGPDHARCGQSRGTSAAGTCWGF